MSAGQLRSRGPASSPVTPARGAQRLADLVDTVVRRPAAGPAAPAARGNAAKVLVVATRRRMGRSRPRPGRAAVPLIARHGADVPTHQTRTARDIHATRTREMHTLYVTAHAITVR